MIKNFNAKVTRLTEKEPYLQEARPQKIRSKDIKEKIVTSQDLNRELKKLERFTKRGSEDIKITKSGVITTEWQFKEASIMQRTITRKRREKRKNIESWQRKEAETLFDKPKPDEIKTEKGFQNYFRSMEREIVSSFDDIRKEQYLENYIQALKNNLGSNSENIINYIRSIPMNTFIENSLTNPFLSVDFTYTDASTIEVSQQILSEWQRVT